jgi:hypothetical protein
MFMCILRNVGRNGPSGYERQHNMAAERRIARVRDGDVTFDWSWIVKKACTLRASRLNGCGDKGDCIGAAEALSGFQTEV